MLGYATVLLQQHLPNVGCSCSLETTHQLALFSFKRIYFKEKERHSCLKDPDVQCNICSTWMLLWVSGVLFSAGCALSHSPSFCCVIKRTCKLGGFVQTVMVMMLLRHMIVPLLDA